MSDDLLSLGLPKWPQMMVTGKQVTPEQAKEIIFRTDPFLVDISKYSGGNAHSFNEWYRKEAGLDRFEVIKDFKTIWRLRAALHQRCGHLSMNYVTNDWASCSFIGGPHGWCSPQGVISYQDNVGKWPSVEEILSDWTVLAAAFPFVDLHVTLMDNEECVEGSKPVVNIRVVNGKATVEQPNTKVHSPYIRPELDYVALFSMAPEVRECGLPYAWVQEYAARVRKEADYVLNHKEEFLLAETDL